MATEFFATGGTDVAITLTPGDNGVLTVHVDGDKIFDKTEEGSQPEPRPGEGAQGDSEGATDPGGRRRLTPHHPRRGVCYPPPEQSVTGAPRFEPGRSSLWTPRQCGRSRCDAGRRAGVSWLTG